MGSCNQSRCVPPSNYLSKLLETEGLSLERCTGGLGLGANWWAGPGGGGGMEAGWYLCLRAYGVGQFRTRTTLHFSSHFGEPKALKGAVSASPPLVFDSWPLGVQVLGVFWVVQI